jgi:hypothetical protein
MAKKKLQAGGETPKNNLDLLNELPYGMMTESDRRFQRNYVTRENDPYSNISFETQRKRDEFNENPFINFEATPRGDEFGTIDYTSPLKPGDPNYVKPTLDISPNEEIIPDAFMSEKTLLQMANTGGLPGGPGYNTLSNSMSLADVRAYETFQKGLVRDVNGDIVNMRDEDGERRFDKANWYQRLRGKDTDGELIRRTYGRGATKSLFDFYMSPFSAAKDAVDEELKQKSERMKAGEGYTKETDPLTGVTKYLNNETGEYEVDPIEMLEDPNFIQRESEFMGFMGPLNPSSVYDSYGYYPIYDEEKGEWYLQETALDEKTFNKVRNALLSPYGVGKLQKSTTASFIDGFEEGLASTVNSLANFSEIVSDTFDFSDSDISPEGWTDRWASRSRVHFEFNKQAKTAMQKTDSLFANNDILANGLGNGLASLLSFWGLGGATTKLVSGPIMRLGARALGKNNPYKWSSFFGHIGGGMPLNAGEIYSIARRDGLDQDDAAVLSLSVGLINTLVEYGVGTNALANRMMGTPSTRMIAGAIQKYAKKGNMKVNDKDFMNAITGPIMQMAYKILQKGDRALQTPFLYLEKLGAKNAGSWGSKLATRGARGLSSGLEEGTEEIIQGAVIEGAQRTYNAFIDETAARGKGAFNFQPFNPASLLEEGAIGFILGGSTRLLTNSSYEGDVMSYIAQGYGQELINMVDHLQGLDMLGPYQAPKLKGRLQKLIDTWNDNSFNFSYLPPEDQYMVGQYLIASGTNKEAIAKLNADKRKIQNSNLTDSEKKEKLRQIDHAINSRQNYENTIQTFLDIYKNPKLLKETKLNKMPLAVRQGIHHLTREKSTHQAYVKYLRDLIADRSNPAARAKLRKILKDLGIDKKEASRTQKALTDAQIKQLEEEIEKREGFISDIDARVDDLINNDSEWKALQQKLDNELKEESEKEKESQGELSEKEKAKEKPPENETEQQRKQRTAKEEEKRKEKEADKISKGVEKIFTPADQTKFIEDKNGKIYEVESVGQDLSKNTIYTTTEKDKDGNPIKISAKDVVLKKNVYDRRLHEGNFLKTFWLQAVGMNQQQTQELQQRIKNDEELIKNIRIKFVNVKRELADNAVDEENMYINMKGSYFIIEDIRTGDTIGVIKTPNRYYDKDGTLLEPGVNMSRQFFYDNFDKQKIFSKQEWKEFGLNYQRLKRMVELLEKKYPNATEEDAAILDDSMFDISASAYLDPNKGETRVLITDIMAGDHRFQGKYRIYDRLDGVGLNNESFTEDEIADLPDMEGRYFVRVKRGELEEWVHVVPRQLDSGEFRSRLERAKKQLDELNKFHKEGKDADLESYVKNINKDLNLFIAGPRRITMQVVADWNRDSGSYELKLFISEKKGEGDFKTLYNKAQRKDVTIENIVATTNRILDKYGLTNIGLNSFKQSIPRAEEGVNIDPSSFESTLELSDNFTNPTLIISPTDAFFDQPIVDETPIKKKKPKKDKAGPRKVQNVPKKKQDIAKEMRDEAGEDMFSLPEGRLRNDIRRDIVRQIVAKYLYGFNLNTNEGIRFLLNTDTDSTTGKEEDAIAQILDSYIEGISIESFLEDLPDTVTPEEYQKVKQQFRQAFLAKLKLQTNKEVRDEIIDDVKRQVFYVQEDLNDITRDFEADFTNLSAIKSLPSRLKQFMSLLSSPQADIFGRTTWQSKQYGTSTIVKTLDGHNLSTHLMKALANSTEGELKARLNALAQYDDQISQVVKALNQPANKHIKTMFYKAFAKNKMDYLKLVGNKSGKFNFINPLTNDGAAQLFNSWKGKNTKDKKAIQEVIDIISKTIDPTSKDINNLINAFDKLGWEITPAAAAYILGDTKLNKAFTDVSIKELSNPKQFFKTYISDFNKKDPTNTNMFKLAQIAAIFDPKIYESSYIDSEGNSHYKYTDRNYYIEAVQGLQNGNTSFIKADENNLLVKNNHLGMLKMFYVGDIVMNKQGKTRKRLSERDRLELMYALFLNRDVNNYAYYIPHVIADKRSIYAVRLPVNNNYYKNGEVTQQAIDDVFNGIFLREFNRNKEGDVLIADKKGNINYFGVLSMLNDAEITIGNKTIKLTDHLKKVKDLDVKMIKEQVIKPMLEQLVTDLNERTKDLNIDKTIGNIQLPKPVPGTATDKLGSFAINHLINAASWTQVMHGDNNFLDDVDMFKRMAGFNAAGPVKGKGDYKYLMINDHRIDTPMGESVTSDAQVYITEEMWAKRELEAGTYANETEYQILKKLASRLDDPTVELTPRERKILDLNSTKTVYEDSNRYFKKSDNIITKEEAEANPDLKRIYDTLNNNRITYLIPVSASKRKSDEALSADFFTKDNELNEDNIYTASFKFERNQVINKTKSREGVETLAVMAKQVHDLIGSVVTQNRNLIDAINDANADQKAAYEVVIQALLADENENAFRQLIYNNSVRNRGPQVLSMIDPSLDYTYNYNLPSIKPLIEDTMVNLFNDGALKSRVVGGVATLIAGTHYLNPQTGKPLAIHKTVDGKIQYAEILASRKMFGLERYKTIEEVPDERLLQAFGTRIPAQAHHSMIPVKVVGFLPNEKGDSIVTPLELPALAGSDYDLDKLFLHRYASHNGKVLEDNEDRAEFKRFWSTTPYVRLIKEKYNIGTVEAMKRLNLLDENQMLVAHPLIKQNEMLTNMLRVFEDPEVMEVMFNPATAGKAEEFLDKYPALQTRKSIHTVVGNLDYNTQNKLGATNVGIGANLNTLVSFFTQHAQGMTTVPLTINGETYNTFDKMIEPDGNNKFDSISSLITWFVDNVKLGYAPQLNLDPDGATVFGHILGMAAGQMEGLMVVNQPILRLYNELKERDSILSNTKTRKEAAKRRREIRSKLLRDLDTKTAKPKTKDKPISEKITTDSLDKGLKRDDIKDLLGMGKRVKLQLTDADRRFLNLQSQILTFADEVLNKYEGEYQPMIVFLATTRGLKGAEGLRDMQINPFIASAHPVFAHNAETIKRMRQTIASKFMTRGEVVQAFINAYGNVTTEDLQKTLKTIQQLKQDPKFKDNLALTRLLKIEKDPESGRLKLVADSFSDMSTEMEGLMMGAFEDLFAGNPTLSDNLIKYLFKTNLLEFRANSFIKFLPKESFKKFNDALIQANTEQLDKKQKTALENQYVKLNKGTRAYMGVTENAEVETDEAPVSILEEKEYTFKEIKSKLNVPEGYNGLLDKLEKAGVKIKYAPDAASYYSGKRIQLGTDSLDVFLEEAIHAGLDVLPKNEKAKLRKDVLKWYKDLIKNHQGKNEIQQIQKIFNRYNDFYNNEEQAAEEIITHLIYKDKRLIEDLNALTDPDAETGILTTLWNKFLKLIADAFGIEIREGSELAKLSDIMSPVNRLFSDEDITLNTEKGNERLYSLPEGSLFQPLVFNNISAEVLSKLNVANEANILVFNGEVMPVEGTLVDLQGAGKLHGQAIIGTKKPEDNFNLRKPAYRDKVAVSLGYKSYQDMLDNAKGRTLKFAQGQRAGMIITLKPSLIKDTDDLISKNTVDPYQNVINNIRVKLHKQLKDLKQVTNKEFAENRGARLRKILNNIEKTGDLFTAIDDFHDDVKMQYDLFTQYLEDIPKLINSGKKEDQAKAVAYLARMQIVLQDMTFLNQLPDAYVEKIKDPNYKPPNGVLEKLQDATLKLSLLQQQMRQQMVPVVTKQLFPYIKKSGPATKKYIDQRIKQVNDNIERIQNANYLSDEVKNKKISIEKAEFERLSRLAEQAPQSEEAYKAFFMYTTHDDSYINYLLTSPATSSDPGVAAIVNYTNAMYNDVRMQAIGYAEELEQAEELLIEYLEAQGKMPKKNKLGLYNPKDLYADLIEITNTRATGGKDVYRFVAETDDSKYDSELEKQENALIKSEKDFIKYKLAYTNYLKKRLEGYNKRLEYLRQIPGYGKNEEDALIVAVYGEETRQDLIASQIAELEASVNRTQAQLDEGVTERQVINYATRSWRSKNTIPLNDKQINSIIKNIDVQDRKSWAVSQMNAAAMLKHKIITVEEFSLLQQVDKSAGLQASNVPRYWGRQVTKGRFINPKFEKLYKTEITDAGKVYTPKNKLGRAHEIMTKIYRDARDQSGANFSVDMQIPSIRRSTLDRVQDYGAWNEIKERVSRLFTIDEDDAYVYGSAVMEQESGRRAPVYFTQDINAEDVSLNIKSTLMVFATSAQKSIANNEVLKTAFLLEEIYKANRSVKPESYDIIGLAKLGRKVNHFREGQSNSEKRISKFIEMVLLGQTKKSDTIDVPLMGRLQVDKVIDTMLGYTAITTLGLDFLKGARNALTAFWQQAIESGANRANPDRLAASDFLAGHKIMTKNWSQLTADKYKKLGNRSHLGQILLKFDAIQGGFEDFTGKEVIGKNAMRSFISTDTFLLNYHVGEVQMQGAAAIGLMLKKKIKLGNNEYNLYNAFVLDKNNKLQYIEGTKEQKAAADKIVAETINEIREMNRRLNGNYRQMDKTPVEQTTLGRPLMLFRKFLLPIVMNRWRTDFINHETGRPDGGFYRRFFRDLLTNYRTSVKTNVFDKIQDAALRATATAEDRELAWKLLHEVGLITVLTGLVTLLTQVLDDEDPENVPPGAYLTLYLLRTTLAEIQAFSPFPTPLNMLKESFRVLRSPSAMTTGIERFIKLGLQFGAPFEEYQRDAGVYEKGDSKLKARLLESFGYTSGVQFNPDIALDNFLAATKRL